MKEVLEQSDEQEEIVSEKNETVPTFEGRIPSTTETTIFTTSTMEKYLSRKEFRRKVIRKKMKSEKIGEKHIYNSAKKL